MSCERQGKLAKPRIIGRERDGARAISMGCGKVVHITTKQGEIVDEVGILWPDGRGELLQTTRLGQSPGRAFHHCAQVERPRIVRAYGERLATGRERGRRIAALR